MELFEEIGKLGGSVNIDKVVGHMRRLKIKKIKTRDYEIELE